MRAIIDPSGTGQFSQGTEAEVMTQVPGRNGNIAPGPKSNNRPQNGQGGGGGGLLGNLLGKRASNVDTDHVSSLTHTSIYTPWAQTDIHVASQSCYSGWDYLPRLHGRHVQCVSPKGCQS